jgi:tetratricopeptide (TPR) repeat protein
MVAFIILLPGFHNAQAQGYADSLETRLVMVDNEEKIIILDQLIGYYFRNEPLLASEKAEKMRSLSMQVGDKVNEIKARRYLGLAKAFLTSNYDQALEDCYAIEEITLENGLIGELALTKIAIADIFRQTGDFTKSLKYQSAARHIADSMDYADLISEILNGEAQNYIDLEDMVRAELALRQSLKNAQFNSLHQQEAEAHALFGEMYYRGINQQMAIAKFTL